MLQNKENKLSLFKSQHVLQLKAETSSKAME